MTTKRQTPGLTHQGRAYLAVMDLLEITQAVLDRIEAMEARVAALEGRLDPAPAHPEPI